MVHNGDGTVDDTGSAAFVPGILAMAECFDPDSDAQRVIEAAVACAAALGADVTMLDLRDLELPPFEDGGVADDLPQGAYAFRQLLCAHDGLLIAPPSDRGRRPPLLINAIAWSVSPAFGAEAGAAYAGKCATLLSGIYENEHPEQPSEGLKETLSQLGVLVMPEALPLAKPNTIDDPAADSSDRISQALEDRVRHLIDTVRWILNRNFN